MSDIENIADAELLSGSGGLCSPETYEEIWDKNMYSVCSKCPYYKSRVNLKLWDTSYVPDYQVKTEMQESVLDVCVKYGMKKFISFTKPQRNPVNLKEAKRL